MASHIKELCTWSKGKVELILIRFTCYIQSFFFQINIDIYYESLCPDSVKFINNQLYPNWAQISPYVNLQFVPFGKSKVSNILNTITKNPSLHVKYLLIYYV